MNPDDYDPFDYDRWPFGEFEDNLEMGFEDEDADYWEDYVERLRLRAPTSADEDEDKYIDAYYESLTELPDGPEPF